MLAGLLAPLRLPERVVEALEELRPMRLELTRVRRQTEPLAELLPALEQLEQTLSARIAAVQDELAALASEESHLARNTSELNAKVGAISDVVAPVGDRLATMERMIHQLAADVGAINETVVGVKDDIQRITGLRGERGIMERARDVLTGSSEEADKPRSEDSAEAS